MKPVYLLIYICIPSILWCQPAVRFAVIGDYGKSSSSELSVSNLVKSWNPEFILTLGDNNYDLGEASTIDVNIGQYYHQFISPYKGSYGEGDSVNRFFPSLGNHDWYTDNAGPYLNYFTLPSNERYYDFIRGDVHFFCIDSDPNEPDGVDSNSVQALWLRDSLAVSKQKFNIVYFHHPPYSSSEHGNNPYMQWPFKEWGATAVFAGHDHVYERIFYDGMHYFVNGLGGRSIYTFNTPVPGSQLRYNNNYGAMKVDSYNDSMVIRFYSISGNQRDYYKIIPPSKVLSLNVFIEGSYDTLFGKMASDTMTVYLRNFTAPYAFVDSSKQVVDSNGTGSFNFKNALNNTGYYLVLKHRNSIETWSMNANTFFANTMSYDFTESDFSAYGNNEKLKGKVYCIYSGDVNQDGFIHLHDMLSTYNDASVFLKGYLPTDVTGDEIVNLNDLLVVYNNSLTFVKALRP